MNNNIPENYKLTEVGVIPMDWEVKELGEICFPSKSRINPITSIENYRCIELEHISQGSGILLGHTNSANLLSQKTVFTKGDVLFGKLRPYLRKFLFAEFDGVCTTEIWVLKTEKNISNRFLYHLVQSDKVIEAANISTGTKMPRAEWKTVSETIIPVPTLAEQTAIATALTEADALISGIEKLIAKKRDIKHGAMQKLLSPTEGWVVRKLGEVLKIKHGKSQKEIEDVSGQYPILGTGGLMNYGNQFLYDKPSVLIGRKGTIDKPQYMDTPFWTVDTLFYTEINERNDAKFIYYMFNLIDWYSYNEASGVPSLNGKTIEKIERSFPLLAEQTRIATILSDMDAEIAVLEKKLEKYRAVKAGMMQNLLTGQIRLVPTE